MERVLGKRGRLTGIWQVSTETNKRKKYRLPSSLGLMIPTNSGASSHSQCYRIEALVLLSASLLFSPVIPSPVYSLDLPSIIFLWDVLQPPLRKNKEK